MLESQFQNPEELEAERLTQEEAAQVVKLWADQQRDSADSTTLGAIAEGLDIPPAKARALLDEVRGNKRTLQELPVTFASSPPASPLATLSVFALGMFLI